MIVANEQPTHSVSRAENEVDKVFGSVQREGWRKWQQRDAANASCGQRLEPLISRREQAGGGGWLEYFEGVRLERDDQRGEARRGSVANEGLQNGLVAPVNAVERANGNDRPLGPVQVGGH